MFINTACSFLTLHFVMTGYIWNMKRRNMECGKLRRPPKKSKISDGMYGSIFLYVKFLFVWALVLMADFILEFRFEYLWPFWLLLRSVFDSFRYQGLAFSVLFVCIAITSDVICYLFVPVQWLFFAGSTYVWVQYVWHTDRGICIPTVSLWLLFVYIEASFRLRELKCMPFHLDLCRPFAAHCIGYPMVTLGFGFKSYISYKLRLRRQKEVQKENEFYYQLLQQALPAELVQSVDNQKNKEGVISNGSAVHVDGHKSDMSSEYTNGSVSSSKDIDKQLLDSRTSDNVDSYDYTEQQHGLRHRQLTNVNDFKEDAGVGDANRKVYKSTAMSSKNSIQSNGVKDNIATATSLAGKKSKSNNSSMSSTSSNTCPYNKDDVLIRLESDLKRLRTELQTSRNCEQDLRYQINMLTTGDKTLRTEIFQLRQDNDSLQNKLHNLVTSRQQDKQSLANLEKKIQEEKKLRNNVEQQLTNEKKKKSEELAAAKAAIAVSVTPKAECTDQCKTRRRDLEKEVKQINWELKLRDDKIRQLEYDIQALRQYKESQSDAEVLMSALTAMQEKTAHLESSLGAETRIKLDLFSALGEAKRQIEIQEGLLARKEAEIADLKTKIAEVMAVMPSPSGFSSICTADSAPHFSAAFTSLSMSSSDTVLANSTLNPNASDYQPKLSP